MACVSLSDETTKYCQCSRLKVTGLQFLQGDVIPLWTRYGAQSRTGEHSALNTEENTQRKEAKRVFIDISSAVNLTYNQAPSILYARISIPVISVLYSLWWL